MNEDENNEMICGNIYNLSIYVELQDLLIRVHKLSFHNV